MINRIQPEAGKPKTYIIRGQEVMLDRDLAQIYGVSLGVFSTQVKRHIDRFPADFMFQLTEDEIKYLNYQRPTLNQLKINEEPCAFAEAGLLMLSSVLKNKKAVQISIGIIRALYGSQSS
ncbi:MAG: ORF6N domain-containing protein [Candidatus Omnitrophota bacterium]|jgi:hypothetical protein